MDTMDVDSGTHQPAGGSKILPPTVTESEGTPKKKRKTDGEREKEGKKKAKKAKADV